MTLALGLILPIMFLSLFIIPIIIFYSVKWRALQLTVMSIIFLIFILFVHSQSKIPFNIRISVQLLFSGIFIIVPVCWLLKTEKHTNLPQ